FTSPASTLAIHTLYVGVSSRACDPLADTSFQSITPRKTIEIQKRIVFAVELEFTLSSLILQPETENKSFSTSFALVRFSCASYWSLEKAAGGCAPSRWLPQGHSQPTYHYVRPGTQRN